MRSLFCASSAENLRLRPSARNEVADVNDVTASATAVAYLHSVSALSHLVVPPPAVAAGGEQSHLTKTERDLHEVRFLMCGKDMNHLIHEDPLRGGS